MRLAITEYHCVVTTKATWNQKWKQACGLELHYLFFSSSHMYEEKNNYWDKRVMTAPSHTCAQKRVVFHRSYLVQQLIFLTSSSIYNRVMLTHITIWGKTTRSLLQQATENKFYWFSLANPYWYELFSYLINAIQANTCKHTNVLKSITYISNASGRFSSLVFKLEL